MSIILGIIGMVAFAAFLCYLCTVKAVKYIILFSRIIICLIIALNVNEQIPLIDNAFFSGVLWTGIVLVGCFFLCLLPRIDCAVMLICNSLIAVLGLILGINILDMILDAIFGGNSFADFIFDSLFLCVLITLAVACFALYKQSYMFSAKIIRSKAVNTVDRVLASLVYGLFIDLFFLVNSLFVHPVMHILIILGISGAMYGLDLLVFDRFMELSRAKGSNASLGSYERFNINLFNSIRDALFPNKNYKA